MRVILDSLEFPFKAEPDSEISFIGLAKFSIIKEIKFCSTSKTHLCDPFLTKEKKRKDEYRKSSLITPNVVSDQTCNLFGHPQNLDK
jgi:hypothetical protein